MAIRKRIQLKGCLDVHVYDVLWLSSDLDEDLKGLIQDLSGNEHASMYDVYMSDLLEDYNYGD